MTANVTPMSPWVTRATARELPVRDKTGDVRVTGNHREALVTWVRRNPDECTQDFDGICRCNFSR